MKFNPWYLALILTALLAWGAQWLVRKVYQKYEVVPNRQGVNGLDLAKTLLVYNGLNDVRIVQTEGALQDHYNPETKTLHLSASILNGASVTSLGIVAHEVGHAVQYAQGHRVIRLRTKLAGPAGRLTGLSPLVFIGGMWLNIPALLALGGLMLLSQAVFALVTLPVERDASTRAVVMLEQTGLVVPAESKEVSQVLRGAGLTYLTGLGQQLASVLFFVAVVGAAGFGGRA